ncbi:MAG: PTS mannose transporter subunit IIA [Bacilli bacterium]
MIKLMIVTHSVLAEGFKESSKLFFGDKADEITAIGLFPSDSPEILEQKIVENIKLIDDGDGVMIFVDIFAGSPFNMVALAIDEVSVKHKIQCFTGINLPLLMEALGSCESMKLDELTKHLNEVSSETIVNLREALDI